MADSPRPRPIPVHIDRLTAALKVAPVRTADADYVAEMRRQLVQFAVTQRIKQAQRNLTDQDARLHTVRKADGVDTRPGSAQAER